MYLKKAMSVVLAEKIKEKGFKNVLAFAKAAKVSQGFLSEFLRDPKVDISTGKLQQMLEQLDMTLAEFFEEVEKKRLRNGRSEDDRGGTGGVLHHATERREKTVVSTH